MLKKLSALLCVSALAAFVAAPGAQANRLYVVHPGHVHIVRHAHVIPRVYVVPHRHHFYRRYYRVH